MQTGLRACEPPIVVAFVPTMMSPLPSTFLSALSAGTSSAVGFTPPSVHTSLTPSGMNLFGAKVIFTSYLHM